MFIQVFFSIADIDNDICDLHTIRSHEKETTAFLSAAGIEPWNMMPFERKKNIRKI